MSTGLIKYPPYKDSIPFVPSSTTTTTTSATVAVPTHSFSFSFKAPSTPTSPNPAESLSDRQRMADFYSRIPNHSPHPASTAATSPSIVSPSHVSSPTPPFSFYNHPSPQPGFRTELAGMAAKLSDHDRSMYNHYKQEGNAFFEKKEYDKACEQYTMALTLIPNDGSLYCQRSSCYLHMDKLKKALQDALKAVFIHPNYTRGYLQCGKCYLQTGMIEKWVL